MKYDYFQDEKLKYEDIEIPDELLLLVRQTVAQDRRKKASVRRNRILRAVGSVAAGITSLYINTKSPQKTLKTKNTAGSLRRRRSSRSRR